MAKAKKSKTKKTSHRGRRVSGVLGANKNDAMEAVGLVAGSMIAAVAQRQMTSINPKIVAGAQIIGGIMIKNHAKSPLMKGIGYGLLSTGSLAIVHEVGIIKGVEDFVSGMTDGDVGYIDESQAGISNDYYSTVNGISNEGSLSGDIMDKQLLYEMQ